MYVSTPVLKRFLCKIYEIYWTEYDVCCVTYFESITYKNKPNKNKPKLGYLEFLKIVKT